MRFEGTTEYAAAEGPMLAVNAAIRCDRPLPVGAGPGSGKTAPTWLRLAVEHDPAVPGAHPAGALPPSCGAPRRRARDVPRIGRLAFLARRRGR